MAESRRVAPGAVHALWVGNVKQALPLIIGPKMGGPVSALVAWATFTHRYLV